MKKFLALLLTPYFAFSPLAADNYESCQPQLCTPCVPQASCGKYTAGADWLYWKNEQSEVRFGSDVSSFTDPSDILQESETFLKPEFKYNSGFRVFGDFTTADSLWTFSTSYVHLDSHLKNSFTASSPLSLIINPAIIKLFPTLSTFGLTTFDLFDGHFDSDVNYIDFDIARSFNPCESFTLTPHMGIRGVWIDQTFKLTATATSTFEPVVYTSKVQSDFKAVGIEGGIAGALQIYDNFSIVGNIGGAVLYAEFHERTELHTTFDFLVTHAQVKDHHNIGLPMFDAFLGVQYANTFNRFNVNVHVGWEEHVIFNTSGVAFPGSQTTLQGLTLGASVSY